MSRDPAPEVGVPWIRVAAHRDARGVEPGVLPNVGAVDPGERHRLHGWAEALKEPKTAFTSL